MTCVYCEIVRKWTTAYPLQIKNGYKCRCGKWHDLSNLKEITHETDKPLQ